MGLVMMRYGGEFDYQRILMKGMGMGCHGGGGSSSGGTTPTAMRFLPEIYVKLTTCHTYLKNSKAKPRLKWEHQLQERFVQSVNALGGEQFATPKKMLYMMNVVGLTLSHLKSHLQKYRVAKRAPPRRSRINRKKKNNLVEHGESSSSAKKSEANNSKRKGPAISTMAAAAAASSLAKSNFNGAGNESETQNTGFETKSYLFPPNNNNNNNMGDIFQAKNSYPSRYYSPEKVMVQSCKVVKEQLPFHQCNESAVEIPELGSKFFSMSVMENVIGGIGWCSFPNSSSINAIANPTRLDSNFSPPTPNSTDFESRFPLIIPNLKWPGSSLLNSRVVVTPTESRSENPMELGSSFLSMDMEPDSSFKERNMVVDAAESEFGSILSSIIPSANTIGPGSSNSLTLNENPMQQSGSSFSSMIENPMDSCTGTGFSSAYDNSMYADFSSSLLETPDENITVEFGHD